MSAGAARPLPHNTRSFNERIEIAGAWSAGATLDEVGRAWGVSRERVRQIWAKEFRRYSGREEYRSHSWGVEDTWAETEVVRRVWSDGYPPDKERELERKWRTRKSRAKPYVPVVAPAWVRWPGWIGGEVNVVQIGDQEVGVGMQERLVTAAKGLDECLNGDGEAGRREFVLMVFEPEGQRCNYVSNGAAGSDLVDMLEEQLKRLKRALR